jgi:DNA invertase Pin-like site-specific DNA recombinase
VAGRRPLQTQRRIKAAVCRTFARIVRCVGGVRAQPDPGAHSSGPRRRSARRPHRSRPPKLTDDDIEAAKAMLANPDIGVTQIAHRLGVSPATLYRYIPAARTVNLPGV